MLGAGAVIAEIESRLLSAARQTDDDAPLLVPGNLRSYIDFVLLFIPFMLAPIVAYRVVAGKKWQDWPLKSLTSNLSDFTKAATAYFLLLLAIYALVYLVYPERFARGINLVSVLPWTLLALVLILIQSLAEEVAFKGFLIRIWGAVFPYRWFLIVVTSLLFATAHWPNDDVARDPVIGILSLVLGSIVSSWLYFRTLGLAAPAGLHWANNVIALLIVVQPGPMSKGAWSVYNDPNLAAGKTNIADVPTWIVLIATNMAIVVLLAHPRSPFFIPKIAAPGDSKAPLLVPADNANVPRVRP